MDRSSKMVALPELDNCKDPPGIEDTLGIEAELQRRVSLQPDTLHSKVWISASSLFLLFKRGGAFGQADDQQPVVVLLPSDEDRCGSCYSADETAIAIRMRAAQESVEKAGRSQRSVPLGRWKSAAHQAGPSANAALFASTMDGIVPEAG